MSRFVTGVPIAGDALALQAGVDLAIGKASRLGFTYDGQFASGTMENAFKASFSTRLWLMSRVLGCKLWRNLCCRSIDHRFAKRDPTFR